MPMITLFEQLGTAGIRKYDGNIVQTSANLMIWILTILTSMKRVDKFDAQTWNQQHKESPGYPRARARIAASSSQLHNPYSGVPYAWQLTETVDDFLLRLPPATTEQTPEAPWIYICNPFIARLQKEQGGGQSSLGNEDEAPEEEGSQVWLVERGARERLEITSSFIDGMNKSSKSKSFIEKELRMERKQAVEDILTLAHVAKVRAGKWMLFCASSEVNEVWGIVAKATANNELGIAAKVAPRPEGGDSRKERLICVYTHDFKDKADVGRVLRRLRELKLVEARGRPIYYKPGRLRSSDSMLTLC
ncbi:hypothetical protein HJFPF1_12902 [Paramyrothecium foliicola]|nr:hypothetical protein HJFPF1_12902 [Paramyrothecium foliicola]